jgi:hypothetical protein
MDHRQILEQAFRRHGESNPLVIESYIRGCDLTLPVFETVLLPGAVFEVWVRDEGIPGAFAAPPGEDPAKLAITISGRHLERYAVRESLSIVVCTAATFTEGLVDRVGGQGGGTQYILPPNWFDAVERTL